ncbi:Cytochrome P450 3A21 [Halotydeus destructor]|nr:Cytochrome P450 3A21 [Halotydeus destructor]
MVDIQTLTSFNNISLTLTSFLVVYTYLWYRKTYSFWSRRGVNGPTPWPIVGNLWPLFFNSYKKVDLANLKKYGKIYGYYEGTQPVLAISDPVILEKIYITNHQDFPNFLELTSPDPLDSNQIMAQEGLNWKRHRSIVSSCFSSSKMKNAAEKTRVCKKALVKYLHSLNGGEVDAKSVFRLYALDVVGKVVFSVEVNAFENQNSQMVKSVGDFFVGFTAWNLFVLSNFPSWVTPYLAKSMNSEDTMAYAKQFVAHVVNGRKDGKDKSDDFVQILVDATSDKDKIEVDGKGLSEIEAMADAVFLFGASYDTTTATMAVASFYLAHNPHVQDRILKELNDVCKAEHITYDELSQMHYLEAVVTETLRLQAPDTRGFRRTVRDDTLIPGTDIKVPANQLVSICYYAAHYDQDNYDEPHKFKPERFLDEEGKKNKKLPFYGFGGGQRMCAGTRLAYLNVKESLATILREFKVEKGPNTPEAVEHEVGAIVLNPGNLFVRFVRR